MPKYISPGVSLQRFGGFGDAFDRTAEKQLAMDQLRIDNQEARAKRSEALQRARMNRDDARYNDGIARQDKKERDDVAARLAASKANTASIDMYNTETVEDKTNVLGKDYDVEGLEKNIGAIPEVHQYKKQDIDKNKLKQLEEYKEINLIDNEYDKKIALNSFFKKYDPEGHKLQGRYGDIGMSLGEGLRTILYDGLAPIGAAIASPLLDATSEIENDKEISERSNELKHRLRTPEEKLQFDMKKIRSKLDYNKTNKEKQDSTQAAYDEFLKNFRTKEIYGTKEIQTPKERAVYLKEVETQIQKDMENIPKNIKGLARDKREIAIRNKYDGQVVAHAKSLSERAKQLTKRQEQIFTAQLKNSSDKALARYKTNLDIAKEDAKNSPQDKEIKRKLDLATTQYRLAQAEKIRRGK